MTESNTNHTTSPELLPCPWCEVPPREQQFSDVSFLAGCMNDDCPVQPVAEADTPEGALAAWNTHQPQSPDTSPVSDAMIEAGVAAYTKAPDKLNALALAKAIFLAMKAAEQSSDHSPVDEVERLRTALRDLIQSCDRGPPMLHDGCGTTILGAPSPDALRKASAALGANR